MASSFLDDVINQKNINRKIFELGSDMKPITINIEKAVAIIWNFRIGKARSPQNKAITEKIMPIGKLYQSQNNLKSHFKQNTLVPLNLTKSTSLPQVMNKDRYRNSMINKYQSFKVKK